MKKHRPPVGRRFRERRKAAAETAQLLPQTQDSGGAFTPQEPYDEGLLAQCRRQWQQGDWSALAELSLEQLENHPDRARLAVMVASAHQALGDLAQTRHLVRFARQWGCDERLLSRVLVAGVHNTLGKAAAAGGRLRDQALAHFRDALAPAGIAAMSRMAMQVRVCRELEGMSLGGQAQRWVLGGQALQALPLGAGRALVKPDDAGTEKAVQRATEAQFAKMGKLFEKTLQREVGNAVKQIEAYANLQGYLTSGELLPTLHGWPVSADFAVLLVELLEQQPFDAVIEFGSGSSTLLMARTLQRLAQRRPTAPPTLQVAFEHLPQYHASTAQLLESAGVRGAVRLELAALVPTQVAGSDPLMFYDTAPALTRLAQDLSERESPRVLVVVDGPPKATGPLARYPALEAVLQTLPSLHAEFLLDDYVRESEQEIARRWLTLLRSQGIEPEIIEYPLEKMACLIRFSARPAVSHSIK